MNGVLWRRWALGLAVAGVVPVAVGGAGCGGKSDENPEPSAGSPSTSGSATAGTAAGGLGASGGAGGNSAAGQSVSGASTGGASTGGASGTCCTPGADSTCSADGHELKWCGSVPGTPCNGSSSFYVNVWQVQACASGCSPVNSGGGPMTAHCN